MSIATRTGDMGKTSLMYGRRVEKFDLRVETYGTVDELNAALGMARAQAELPLVQSGVAADPKAAGRADGRAGRRAAGRGAVREGQISQADAGDADSTSMNLVAKIEKEKITFDGWATPGASVASAALDVARTICRRAERLVAKLAASNEIDFLVIRYLNRLSDLLWLMARYTETKG